MAPPLLPITLQAAALSVVSSLLAQVLTAYRNGTPLAIDWNPVLKFVVFTFLQTPPNVLWQDFLERSFPGMRPAAEEKEKKKGETAGKTDGKTDGKPPPRQLDVRNTLVKTLLDQSAGACVNTFLFCAFMAWWDGAPPGHDHHHLAAAVARRTRADFLGLLTAGWRFWPLVSLGNFALVRDVATRNLVGGLAGIVWGVYVNLFAAAGAAKAD